MTVVIINFTGDTTVLTIVVNVGYVAMSFFTVGTNVVNNLISTFIIVITVVTVDVNLVPPDIYLVTPVINRVKSLNKGVSVLPTPFTVADSVQVGLVPTPVILLPNPPRTLLVDRTRPLTPRTAPVTPLFRLLYTALKSLIFNVPCVMLLLIPTKHRATLRNVRPFPLLFRVTVIFYP